MEYLSHVQDLHMLIGILVAGSMVGWVLEMIMEKRRRAEIDRSIADHRETLEGNDQ